MEFAGLEMTTVGLFIKKSMTGKKTTKDDEITKEKEMVAKIFDMMEAFTKRFIEIDKKIET